MTAFELMPGQSESSRVSFIGPSFEKANQPQSSSPDVDSALKSFQTASARATGLGLIASFAGSLMSGFRRISQGN